MPLGESSRHRSTTGVKSRSKPSAASMRPREAARSLSVAGSFIAASRAAGGSVGATGRSRLTCPPSSSTAMIGRGS